MNKKRLEIEEYIIYLSKKIINFIDENVLSFDHLFILSDIMVKYNDDEIIPHVEILATAIDNYIENLDKGKKCNFDGLYKIEKRKRKLEKITN